MAWLKIPWWCSRQTTVMDCLEQDGLGLVEYAMTLRDSGCVLLFEVKTGGSPGGGHRRLQAGGVFGQRIGVSQPTCEWDELDDLADELDLVCCGADNALCPAAQGSPQFPASCSPLCAVAMHSFTAACGPSLEAIFGEGGGRRTAEHFGIPFIGQLPLDARIRECADGGAPIVSALPESPAANTVRDIAATIVDRAASFRQSMS